ncbi:ZirU family protein [Pseudomonas sp. 5P_3.1_Bac2]|uniref:ZirU family protein n=1 Tax=Pseudomonas sp. 5P_3.1_Bac2 TaxID=2971617 RepID=UPI0021C82493|nr:ZirU family protein [Pseudomonas sp. 5P_3.1_Bac2]MCU1719464.1 ZirU family protein [Pseudomonas sp. 5P_3.1_Bac2]
MKAQLSKKTSQLLALSFGLAFTASSFAAVTSSPTATVMGHAPEVITPAVISLKTDADGNGLINAGDTLKAEWNIATDVTDADGDDISASSYEWFADGVSVGDSTELVITEAHRGKQITLKTTALTDPSITDPVMSEPALASIDPAIGPEISIPGEGTALGVTINGMVDGSPKVGTALTAVVACEGSCGTLTYQWQIESAVGSGSFNNIAGATSQAYTPLKGDQKRQIQVVVGN